MGSLPTSVDYVHLYNNKQGSIFINTVIYYIINRYMEGVQWLSVRVLYSRPRGRRFEPHQHHCVASLSKNINPSLVLVQPRKTRPLITERLLLGCKESNQTDKSTDTWPKFSRRNEIGYKIIALYDQGCVHCAINH